MEQWLLHTPKVLLAFIFGAILVFLTISFKPLPDICSTQLDVFKESQATFLYKRGTSKTPLPPEFDREFEKCAEIAGVGGCLALFQNLRGLLRQLHPMRSECQVETVRTKPVRDALEQSYTLMTHLAWGGKVPARAQDRTHWFERGDIHLYCQLGRYIKLGRGDEGMERLQREIMGTLPGGVEISTEELWSKTVMSLNCQQI